MRHLLSKKEIIIDLTSLLDVIFIVLMVVMLGLTQSKAGEATESDSSAKVTEDHCNKYGELEEYVLFVDIVSDIGDSTDAFLADPEHERKLYCVRGIGDSVDGMWDTPDGEADHIVISDSNEDEILGTDGVLDKKLRGIVDSEMEASKSLKYGSRVLILSVNRNEDKILYRDEKKISDLLENIVEDYKDSSLIISVR